MDVEDYKEILEQSTALLLVLDPDLTIVSVTDAYLKATMTIRENIIGKNVFEVFPNNPMETNADGVSIMKASFDRVLKNNAPDAMPIIKYDIKKPESEGGGFEPRYWKPYNTPVIGANNNVKYIINRAEDVTENETLIEQLEEEKQMLRQILDSEKRYNMMLMQSPFAFAVLKGKDMVVTFANDSIKEMWGKGKEIEGKPLIEILPEIKDQGFPELLDGVYTTGIPYTAYEILVQLMRNDKIENVYFNFVYQPYREADETISGVAIIANDVTTDVIAKKIIEETQAQFHFIADSMPQKIWTSRADGKANYFNKTWLDYTGLTIEELSDVGWDKIIHPADWEENKKKWYHSEETGDDFEVEHRYLNKDGEYLWHLSRAIAYKDENGKIKMWIGTNTEIHEQKKQKEELEKAVVTRTSELNEANENLEEKNEELQKMNKELEAFTYLSSHDLQEPLRKIQTLASRIIEKENLTLKGKDYFLRMQSTANQMQTLIEDLLSYSRTNNTERKFENIDLNIIIDEVKAELKEIMQKKHATIEATELCEIKIIPFQFRQLMLNLIGNAIKFSKPNHPPHIVIKSRIGNGSKLNNEKLLPEKHYCHLTISDNGIGFDPQFENRIFEVFQKLHSKEEYPGTGIGLAIVKKIVENHDGIITGTSKLNEGATFDIYIPAF